MLRWMFDLLRKLQWSLLAAFGNTPLAKAVLFTPIVAGYVFYSNEYLKARWGFENALWLYWSLLFLSAGQLVFVYRAPTEAKRFGDNRSAFVDQGLRTLSDRSLNLEASKYLGRLFLPSREGTLPDLDEEGYLGEDLDLVLAEHDDPNSVSTPYASTKWILNSIRRSNPVRPDIKSRRLHRDKLVEVLSKFQGRELTEDQIENVNELVRFMNQPSSSDDWKKELLEYLFDHAQVSRPISKLFVATLYSAGSGYFLWHTVQTIQKMSRVTFTEISSVLQGLSAQ